MNVLVAVDGSKFGKRAIMWVDQLLLGTPLTLRALHIIDIEPQSLRIPFIPPLNKVLIQKEIKRRVAEGRRIAKETKTLLSSLGVMGKVITDRGLIARTILKYVKGKGGLLIVGNRGLDALDRFMLGSVSTKLIHHAPCSVLVVKQESRPLKNILLATDGSISSIKALQFLTKKMAPRKLTSYGPGTPAEVVVIHVMPFLWYPAAEELGKAIVQHAVGRLSKAGYQVEEVSKLGNPVEEIIKYAKQAKVDLLVTGARGMGALGGFLLGSVSTKLIQHSPCTVLVVK
jgi:nucleotide-binding universal stress UspA family protein